MFRKVALRWTVLRFGIVNESEWLTRTLNIGPWIVMIMLSSVIKTRRNKRPTTTTYNMLFFYTHSMWKWNTRIWLLGVLRILFWQSRLWSRNRTLFVWNLWGDVCRTWLQKLWLDLPLISIMYFIYKETTKEIHLESTIPFDELIESN